VNRLLNKVTGAPDYRIRIVILVGTLFLWALLHLSKEDHRATYKANIQYGDYPKNRILLNEGDYPSVQVEAKGHGFTLLNYYLFGPPAIEIDIRKMVNAPDGQFVFSENQKALSNTFSDRIQVIQVEPDTLRFSFTSKGTVTLPVRVVQQFSFSQGYRAYGSEDVSPSAIAVYGPQSVLDTLKYISTEAWSPKEVNEAQSARLQLVRPSIEQLELSVATVQVTQDVDQFTEGEMEVSIALKNLPENLTVHALPNKTTIKFIAAFRDFPKITEQDFRVTMDYSTADLENSRAQLIIENVSGLPEIIDWYPQRIDLILIK